MVLGNITVITADTISPLTAKSLLLVQYERANLWGRWPITSDLPLGDGACQRKEGFCADKEGIETL